MTTLDEALRERAKRGELNYISLVPKAGASATGVVYVAWYRGVTEGASGFGEHADPAEAIKLAIKSAKAPARRKQINDEPDFG